MPDTKISALTALAQANIDTAADLVPIVDTSASATKRTTVLELVKSVFDPANPGAIGGTTPAAGAFTTLNISTSLRDSASNTLLAVTAAASAVNYLTLANAATGNPPTVTAKGSDTNVGTRFVNKGTGPFQIKHGATSGNSQEWLNSSGTVVASMRQDGALTVGTYGIQTPGIYTTGGGICASTTTYASNNALGAVSLSVANAFGFPGAQSLSGAGAVNVTNTLTKLTTTGAAQALTLADGTDGMIKIIVHDVDGGSAVLTPTTKTGFSTITFNNAGDAVQLMFVTTRGWMVIGSYGVVIA